jgi:glycosyltransferase involved in cell wall biosynthesis
MGGGERHILTLLEGFKDRPVNMSLAVFVEGKLSAAARELGVEVFVIPKRYRGDVRPLLDLIRLIKTKHIDIVHTHLISGNFYGRLAGKAAKVKGIVSTLHHLDKEALGRFSLPFMQDLLFRLDISMTFLSDRIIAPSLELKRLLLKHRVREEKIVHIPNAINFEHLQLPKEGTSVSRKRLGLPMNGKLVGMVGRMVPVKNFSLFLRAAKRVTNSGIKAKFVLVGDGPLLSELQKEVADLKLEEHVVFTGFREDVLQIVSILDVFVLCSNSETFPLALIEAMALKKPVIATNVGGIPEIIDHMINGWLCPPGDEVALANSITHLLTHKEKAIEFGNRAYEKVVTTFALRGMTDKLLDVYYGLLNY